MAKNKTVYVCSECGFESPKYWGKCPDCNQWNTFTEMDSKKLEEITNQTRAIFTPKAENLRDVDTRADQRLTTGIPELDNTLGGGMVPSSLVLIGGEPGVGKSTLLLQVAHNVSKQNRTVLYASGEESLSQLKLRLERLDLADCDIMVLANTDIEQIIASAKDLKPDLLIIDSIQTVYIQSLTSAPGTLTQVREATNLLMNFAKNTTTTVFMVGHITKQGTLAGPKTVEHMVDTVLYFESQDNGDLRIIRASKNRFGSTNEVGIFEMTQSGLQCVTNPSATLISGRVLNASGSAICASMEGSRAIMIELQALASSSSFPSPRRMSSGFEYNRFVLLLAVIEKITGIKLMDSDVYLNVVGGIKIDETAADLAVICAVISSLKNRPIPSDTAIFGEVGLCGEVRSVSNPLKRIREISALGFRRVIIPRNNMKKADADGLDIQVVEVANLYECLKSLFAVAKGAKGKDDL